MAEHVKVLGIIGLVRACLGVALGAWLLWKARSLQPSDYHGLTHVTEQTVELDRTAFAAVGIVSVALAPVWLLQGVLALGRRRLARPLGIAIAVMDLVALPLFPLSTALGLYGLVVFRNPNTAVSLGTGPTRAPLGG